jgi:hypothetical protein
MAVTLVLPTPPAGIKVEFAGLLSDSQLHVSRAPYAAETARLRAAETAADEAQTSKAGAHTLARGSLERATDAHARALVVGLYSLNPAWNHLVSTLEPIKGKTGSKICF